jgi:hypothetical protein
VRLTAKLAEQWKKGFIQLRKAAAKLPEHPERRSILSVAEALAIQFASGSRILRFYQLRRSSSPAPEEMLLLMKQEIKERNRLSVLCGEDSRLGFHSEAEVYLYDAVRIQNSIRVMRRRMQELKNGIPAPGKEVYSYRLNSRWHDNQTFRWRVDARKNRRILLTLEVSPIPERRIFEFAVTDEWISEPVRFLRWDSSGILCCHWNDIQSRWIDPTHFEAEIKMPYRKNRFSISCALGPHDRETMLDAWPERPNHQKPALRLEFRYFLPSYTGILVKDPPRPHGCPDRTR